MKLVIYDVTSDFLQENILSIIRIGRFYQFRSAYSFVYH